MEEQAIREELEEIKAQVRNLDTKFDKIYTALTGDPTNPIGILARVQSIETSIADYKEFKQVVEKDKSYVKGVLNFGLWSGAASMVGWLIMAAKAYFSK